jgi:hypothetical protein
VRQGRKSVKRATATTSSAKKRRKDPLEEDELDAFIAEDGDEDTEEM